MKRILAAGFMAIIATAAQAQSAAWSVSNTCSVTSSLEPDQVQLSVQTVVSEKPDGSKGEAMYVRFVSTEKLSDAATTFIGAKLEISGALDALEVPAIGGPSGNNYVVTITFSGVDQKLIKAMSAGNEARLSLPTSDGERVLSKVLQGSGLAMRKLRQCLN